MESTVQRLNLQREVVFVPHHSDLGFSVRCGHHYASLSRIQLLVGIVDGAAKIVRGLSAAETRQVGGDKPSLSVGHVALRTSGLAKEKSLAPFWIARQFGRRGLTLQAAQVADHGLNLRGFHRTKGWHPRSRYAVVDNADESFVR